MSLETDGAIENASELQGYDKRHMFFELEFLLDICPV